MSFTVTDLFCGAGGSSLGAEAVKGIEIVLAMNHWRTAIDVHQANFPQAKHDCADISQADPRRYQRTDILLASPECTNHSQAKGVSRKSQDPNSYDFDPAAERSRATMWDVVRFTEQNLYDAIIVENVVEATKWIFWEQWLGCMTAMGYEYKAISANSMYFGVPQSRDRLYVAFWRKGLRPDLELEQQAFCGYCEKVTQCRQSFKNGRVVGRYKQQWIWRCAECANEVWPTTVPAATIIDWDLPCPRIGDRPRPLAQKTRDRILAGLQRYGYAPVITAGAGHVWEGTPGMRARPLTDPLPTQHTSSTSALATPPGFLMQTAHEGRPSSLDKPHPTVTASYDIHSLVIPIRNNGTPYPVTDPLGAVCAGGNHHGLLMRNNQGMAEMITPTSEPARTLTTHGHQSLLVPFNRTGVARSVDEPAMTMTTRERGGLLNVDQAVDDCGFRMLQPHEISAAMAFPDGYIPDHYTKRERVRLAGNAVTPPAMTWIMGRVAQALESAGAAAA